MLWERPRHKGPQSVMIQTLRMDGFWGGEGEGLGSKPDHRKKGTPSSIVFNRHAPGLKVGDPPVGHAPPVPRKCTVILLSTEFCTFRKASLRRRQEEEAVEVWKQENGNRRSTETSSPDSGDVYRRDRDRCIWTGSQLSPIPVPSGEILPQKTKQITGLEKWSSG